MWIFDDIESIEGAIYFSKKILSSSINLKRRIVVIIPTLEDLNLISISKGVRRKQSFDSIHLANGKTIQIDESSVFCRFIQEIRDETHRFAITSLKKRRSKSSIKSSLDNLSGIGSGRKKTLLRYFGSLEQIKRASIEDLYKVRGIGRITAESIFKQLHS